MFIIAIIAAVLLIIALVVRGFAPEKAYHPEDMSPKKIWSFIALGFGVLILLFAGLGSFFTQDPGQSSVMKDWTGNVVGYESSQGLHWKAPWVDPVTFDVRNQRAVYTGGNSQGDNSGGEANGAQITVQDKDGVTSNIDIAIRYSINPSSVVAIYNQYGSEDNLRTRLIFNDIRSVVRSVPGKYTTLELLTQRNDVQAAIQKALEEKWADDGIIVDDVALQEVRPPKDVQASYAEAQNAQIAVSTEQNKLDAAKVSAQQKIVQAEAEAKANNLLTQSLSPEVLQQHYIDALGKGTIYVVPQGSTPLVSTGK